MTDIDQNRFALMAALTRANMGRPDVYANPGTLIAMSDDALRSYAEHLLHSLEAAQGDDSVAAELQAQLQQILDETP